MCGFVLAYNGARIPPTTDHSIKLMSRILQHRGPDESGTKRLSNVIAAHRRLAIVDLIGGKQPMISADGRFLLVYNGEIYNYREIRDDLAALGWTFRDNSDTEVLLIAWQQWGDASLDRLDGMFAFVIYDAIEDRIYAARDRFGEKPLYYLQGATTLFFASELKALVAAGLSNKIISRSALASYFTLGYVTGSQSIFADIKRLKPGNILSKSGLHEECRSWWSPPRPTEEITDTDYVIRSSLDLLRNSVSKRMLADVPVGFFLSGGLDSSAMVGLAAETATSTLKTFAIGFDKDNYDERRFARMVAKRFGTEHHEFTVTPSALDVLERIAWHTDEPFADQAALPMWYLSQMTGKQVAVALSGDGGDELFAGYNIYRSQNVSNAVRRLPVSIRNAVSTLLKEVGRSHDGVLRIARNIDLAALDPISRFISKQEQVFDLSELPAALVRTTLTDTQRELFSPLYDPSLSHLSAIALWQQTTSLPDDMLHKVDRMSMAHSVEVRAPFLDHKLFELLNRASFSVKTQNGQLKYVLRQALSGLLPNEVLARKKHGFEVPLTSWFREDLENFSKSELNSQSSVCMSIFSEEKIGAVLRAHSEGRVNRDKAIWSLLMFEQWCRVYGINKQSFDLA